VAGGYNALEEIVYNVLELWDQEDMVQEGMVLDAQDLVVVLEEDDLGAAKWAERHLSHLSLTQKV
jgi:hypothetical protein